MEKRGYILLMYGIGSEEGLVCLKACLIFQLH